MSEIDASMDSIGTRRYPTGVDDAQALASAVSWAAIFAGAAGAAALSLLLLILGTGLGFSAVSPWTTEGISAATFGFAAIAWLSFTQLAASGMGGYLAGRLRTKWTAVHTDEVYFRDTAHGFLAWALATLLTAAMLTSIMGSIAGGGVSSAVGNGADEVGNTIEYYVDSLFRDDSAGSVAGVAQQARESTEIPTGEVARIYARALSTGTLTQEDERYIGRLIAQRTELSQQEAELRVAEGFSEVQTTLDEAREASAYASLWMFVTLLIGAFVASLMAVFGGRQRDA